MKQKDYIFIGGITLLIFTGTYLVLAMVGLVPEQFKIVTTKPPVANNQIPNEYNLQNPPNIPSNTNNPKDVQLIPTKIEIPKIGVSSVIQAPKSVDVATLDDALTRGAVYYPGSGTLQNGNIFLFGHSTNWKVVNNEAYKTFNDLQKLKAGDEITLTSGGQEYVYVVQTVKVASEDDALVQFASNGRMLTISTCDTFGRKQDRWVVEAEFKTII